jgi:hypothetical protein
MNYFIMLILVSIFCFSYDSDDLQDKSKDKQYNLDVYPEVMNLLFPRDTFSSVRLEGLKKDLTALVTIRISSSFENEYQINLRCFSDGEVEGVVLRQSVLTNGIWNTLAELSTKGQLRSPEAMAKEFIIKKEKITRSDRLKSLLKELKSVSVIALPESDTILDSTKYEYWCTTTSGEIYTSIILKADNRNKQLVEWITKIKLITDRK